MTHTFRGIALVGNQGVGKTTLAKHLEQTFFLLRKHPKSLFGAMVSPIMLSMGVPFDELEPRIFGSRINDPLPEPFQHKTSRHLLQAAGGGFLKDFGVEGLAHSLMMPPPGALMLIESVRRPEEAVWLRNNGFALIRLERPSLGGPTYEHATEVDLSSVVVDATITNQGDIAALLRTGEDAIEMVMGIKPIARSHVLLIINGSPTCGKDTFTDMLREVCKGNDVEFGFLSSIQPVKDMLAYSGIDTSRKTPADRDLLAAIKKAMCDHNDWPTQWIVDAHNSLIGSCKNKRTLFVTHIREHSEIAKLASASPHVISAWMFRPGVADSGATNAGDRASACEYGYDMHISNLGTLEDLKRFSVRVLHEMFSLEKR